VQSELGDNQKSTVVTSYQPSIFLNSHHKSMTTHTLSASQKWSIIHRVIDDFRDNVSEVYCRNSCCYNSSCQPYVRSRASSSFSRTVHGPTGALEAIKFLAHNFARC